MDKIKKALKENKTIAIIICSVFILSFILLYFLSIRPSQIRKQCSETRKYDSYQYTNPEYNETKEREKQKMLVDYIDCRNNNLAGGDQVYVKQQGNNPYTPTQEQYNTLPIDGLIRYIEFTRSINEGNDSSKESLTKNFDPKIYCAMFGACDDLEKLNQYALGKLDPSFFHAYNGYIIDNPTYDELKQNSNKYPQCIFPADFVQKKLSGGSGEYKANASDTEYKSCLRNHGLDN